jgi:hypothetical protein
MAARVMILVPPFLKYVSGPLLGPAMLAGAGQQAGHHVQVLDLNARWIRDELPAGIAVEPQPFLGDHDRPSDILRRLQERFVAVGLRCAPAGWHGDRGGSGVLWPELDHDAMLQAARTLARSDEGRWIRRHLETAETPDLVGVSVLYGGQVLWALATSLVARELWPGACIVWGGPQVTALRHEIAADSRYGAAIDHFVFGYAERTFVSMLDAVDRGTRMPREAIRAGEGMDLDAEGAADVAPAFTELELYGWGRTTLPAQTSRGCAYGKCAFCTYPAVEGRYRLLGLEPVLAVVDHAVEIGAAVSFKDSLLTWQRLDALAERIAGRVRWSACTKLQPALDAARLARLAAGGCATLEVGLETLEPGSQRLIDKRQSRELFRRTLDSAASSGIALVVNYMTGFPGADPAVERAYLDEVRAELAARPALTAKIEHNTFQLERLSPMGREPARYGLVVTERWPWATVLGWRASTHAQPRRAGAAGRAADSLSGRSSAWPT